MQVLQGLGEEPQEPREREPARFVAVGNSLPCEARDQATLAEAGRTAIARAVLLVRTGHLRETWPSWKVTIAALGLL